MFIFCNRRFFTFLGVSDSKIGFSSMPTVSIHEFECCLQRMNAREGVFDRYELVKSGGNVICSSRRTF